MYFLCVRIPVGCLRLNFEKFDGPTSKAHADADSPYVCDVTTSENPAPMRDREKSTPEICVRSWRNSMNKLCTCFAF